jgi:hypothetical protein
MQNKKTTYPKIDGFLFVRYFHFDFFAATRAFSFAIIAKNNGTSALGMNQHVLSTSLFDLYYIAPAIKFIILYSCS